MRGPHEARPPRHLARRQAAGRGGAGGPHPPAGDPDPDAQRRRRSGQEQPQQRRPPGERHDRADHRRPVAVRQGDELRPELGEGPGEQLRRLLPGDRRPRAHRQRPKRPDALRATSPATSTATTRSTATSPRPPTRAASAWSSSTDPTPAISWPAGIVPGSGQYVSKFDPSTGKEIWRTWLSNVNISGQWFALGSLAIIKDGTLVAAAGHTFWKLDPQ